MPFASSLAALTLTCKDLDASVRLYRAVGVDLKEARHGGPLHFTASLGGVHLALLGHDGVERGPQSGTQVALSVNDLEVGRNVDEALRLVHALQFFEKNGEVCPAAWQPGGKTLSPSLDLVGKI